MKVRAVLILLFIAANAFAYRTAAWIPPWDASALTSIQLHAGDLDESNPVWYSLSSGGAHSVDGGLSPSTQLMLESHDPVTPESA